MSAKTIASAWPTVSALTSRSGQATWRCRFDVKTTRGIVWFSSTPLVERPQPDSTAGVLNVFELREAALEKPAFRLLLRECKCLFVGVARFRGAAEPAVE